jgi:hypothetical protein
VLLESTKKHSDVLDFSSLNGENKCKQNFGLKTSLIEAPYYFQTQEIREIPFLFPFQRQRSELYLHNL